MRELTQSTAANVMVFMTDSTDHVTGKASLTLTITASKDGSAFASITPTVTDRGSGWYNLALTTTHTNTLGDLAIHITSTGADPTDFYARVIALNKADSVRAGMTALPNATAGANTGLPVVGTQVPNATVNTAGGLAVIGTGTNNFKSDASANVTAASVVGAVGSVTGNVGGNVVGSTASVTGAVGSVTGNVGGNVTGSVGSISGVTFPTGFSTLTVAAIQSGLATSANQTTIITHLTDIKGSGWVTGDNLHSRLDAAITSRMASFTYTAPDNTSITAIKAKTDNLPASPAQTSDVLSRLAASAYVAPDNASIGQVITNTEGIQTTLATAFPANFADMLIDADGRAIVDSLKVHWVLTGNTLNVYRADNTTLAYSKTVTTDAAAVPVTGN